MNRDLQNLIALQDIDQKIFSLQKEISEVPSKVSAFRDELQRITENHQEKVRQSQEMAKRRRAREGDVEVMRTKLSRYREQLMTVKTNKEYTAMMHEIQMAEDQIRTAEDEILEIMEQTENRDAEIKAAEEALRTKTAELENGIRTFEVSVPGLEEAVTRLLDQKFMVEKGIPEELLERYRRISKAAKGIALAEARGELCSICHVRIRPQVYADLTQAEVIHSCDSCSRILFVREAV